MPAERLLERGRELVTKKKKEQGNREKEGEKIIL